MVSLEDIKKLREMTQASMIDCRNALEEAEGDFEKAREVLQKRGAALAEKKAARNAKEGIVEAYIHTNRKVGVLVELRCETDFVAKNEEFKTLAHEIAMHIAAMNPTYVSEDSIPGEVIDAEKEVWREEFQKSGKPPLVLKQIIEGKVKKYAEAHALLAQPYIRDEEKTIQDLINSYIAKLGENVRIEKFMRYEI